MRSLLLLAVSVAIIGCSGPVPRAVPSESAATQSPAASLGDLSPAPFVAEQDGLRLVATFDRLEVGSGGEVGVELQLHNDRPAEVVFEEPCDADAMVVEVPNPVEPMGREWDGVAGQFKAYVLERSQGTPIESSIRTPLRTTATALPCHADVHQEGVATLGTIAAGGTYETTLTWSAEYVRDLPAGPGEVPFTIEIRYDFEEAGNGMFTVETIAVEGAIMILPGGPAPVSAGQAIDAALADEAFATWLAEQPRDSWENANLFIQGGAMGDAIGALPAVPYWIVELYRVPRNWAILQVDASTGDVLKRDFCPDPCDR